MQIVRDVAGYTMGHSDLVRRAMAKKKHDVMLQERENFVAGAAKNGVSEEISNKIFDQMIDFASYAFNKAHAACYAVVAYETAWLKVYYPVELMAATMNSLLGSNDKISAYIMTARDMGIGILPPSVNESGSKFSVRDGKIRFGLAALKNVGEGAVRSMVLEREQNGKYKSFYDFCRRMSGTEINKRAVESFIKAGAFDGMGANRAQLLLSFESVLDDIQSGSKRVAEGQLSLLDLFAEDENTAADAEYPDVPELAGNLLLAYEKEVTGIYISGHPLEEYKDFIARYTNIRSDDLRPAEDETGDAGPHGEPHYPDHVKDNMNVVYCGVVSNVKRKITKNNATMAFVTVSDLYGDAELLVFPKIYENFRPLFAEDTVIAVRGHLSIREDDTPKIIPDFVSVPEEFAKQDSMSGSRSGPRGTRGGAEDGGTKIRSYRCPETLKDRVAAFFRFFDGPVPVLLKDENGAVLFEGGFSAMPEAEELLMELLPQGNDPVASV